MNVDDTVLSNIKNAFSFLVQKGYSHEVEVSRSGEPRVMFSKGTLRFNVENDFRNGACNIMVLHPGSSVAGGVDLVGLLISKFGVRGFSAIKVDTKCASNDPVSSEIFFQAAILSTWIDEIERRFLTPN